MNVFAASAGSLQLERELDEYNYVLSIEWDQKDRKFYEAETAKFLEKISALVREQGLTPKDLVALAEKRATNKQAFEAVKLRLGVLGGAKSEAELLEILKESSAEFYAKGASWNGSVVLVGGAVLLVAALIGYTIWFAANYQCVATEERYECNSTSRTDSWGNVYTDTVCGYKDVCVAYEKKQ
jgi:hypothetical protein